MVRTWVRALGAALMTAAIAGAGQLGIAYGLAILRWDQSFDAGRDNMWSAHLTWTAWIASVAVVAGAIGGVRALRRNHIREGFGGLVAVSVAAFVGAAVVLPLAALPSGVTVVHAAGDPELNVGLAAGFGAIVGLFAALAALTARPVAGSIVVTISWVWLAGVVSAASGAGRRPPPDVRLGVLDLVNFGFGLQQTLVLPVLVGMALLTGVGIAAYAHWLGERPAMVMVSGLAGPSLVAAAYIFAGPGISGEHQDQRLPWLAALIGVGTGVAASVVVTMLLRRRPPAEASTEEPRQRPPEDKPTIAVPQPVPPAPVAEPAGKPRRHREEEYDTWMSALRDHTGDADELRSRAGRNHPAHAEPDDPTEPLTWGDRLTRPYVTHAD